MDIELSSLHQQLKKYHKLQQLVFAELFRAYQCEQTSGAFSLLPDELALMIIKMAPKLCLTCHRFACILAELSPLDYIRPDLQMPSPIAGLSVLDICMFARGRPSLAHMGTSYRDRLRKYIYLPHDYAYIRNIILTDISGGDSSPYGDLFAMTKNSSITISKDTIHVDGHHISILDDYQQSVLVTYAMNYPCRGYLLLGNLYIRYLNHLMTVTYGNQLVTTFHVILSNFKLVYNDSSIVAVIFMHDALVLYLDDYLGDYTEWQALKNLVAF